MAEFTAESAGFNCERLHELAAELALGVLPGRDRAEALAHLNECPDCLEHVQALTQVGDSLLGLLPGVEPPVGFENRVAGRLGFGGRRNRRPRWLPITLAAAVAAVLFGVGGWALGSAGHGGDQPSLRTAALFGPRHQQVGEVFAYAGAGHPAWVYMAVDTGDVHGRVSCDLERAGGGLIPVGSFAVADGYGSWGAPISVDPSAVVGARLVSDTGAVLATAVFAR
ncbi:MAG TPA: hypothetical protein VG317_03250 [Pseudonocardiaceae bacterium]|jgi:hypothetical protein|nr:hypothetical protein [Pseudonocardiaceae bacterium]